MPSKCPSSDKITHFFWGVWKHTPITELEVRAKQALLKLVSFNSLTTVGLSGPIKSPGGGWQPLPPMLASNSLGVGDKDGQQEEPRAKPQTFTWTETKWWGLASISRASCIRFVSMVTTATVNPQKQAKHNYYTFSILLSLSLIPHSHPTQKKESHSWMFRHFHKISALFWDTIIPTRHWFGSYMLSLSKHYIA